jgi:hypothetical protein
VKLSRRTLKRYGKKVRCKRSERRVRVRKQKQEEEGRYHVKENKII